jgi:hypothetical protein
MAHWQSRRATPLTGGVTAAIGGLCDRVKLALEARRQRAALTRELAGLADLGELDAVLADAGINRSEVPELLRAHPDAAPQLAQMLQRLGIDPDRVAVPPLLRDVERRCIGCRTWRECRAWLARPDDGDRAWTAFCPNAEALAALAAGAARRQPEDHVRRSA